MHYILVGFYFSSFLTIHCHGPRTMVLENEKMNYRHRYEIYTIFQQYILIILINIVLIKMLFSNDYRKNGVRVYFQ